MKLIETERNLFEDQYKDLKYESPVNQKKFVNQILNLEVKRAEIVDQEKHLLLMRGGNLQWKNELRDYNDKQKILVKESNRDYKQIG
jgi:hypothetical protein